jgi:hypothetical protein
MVLVDCARRQTTIAYSELVQKIKVLDLQAHDPRLDGLLGQISIEETGHGHRMLSVLVVHKSGDLRPGRGFYECAEALGLDTSDEDRLWVDQLPASRSNPLAVPQVSGIVFAIVHVGRRSARQSRTDWKQQSDGKERGLGAEGYWRTIVSMLGGEQ